MGLGHVMRCLALADALRPLGAASTFLCGRQAGEWVAERGHTHALVRTAAAAAEGPDGWLDDARQTRSAIEQQATRPDWLIVDHYSLDSRWHRAMRDCGERLMVVDDLADRALDCDLLVDHNHAADHRLKYDGRVAPATRILGGPRFALLRQRFADAPKYEVRSRVDSIGIFMGGADQPNLTEMAVHACRGRAAFEGHIEIAVTRMNPNLDRLRALAGAVEDVDLSVDQPDLAAFFARHDLQIGAAGGATWERCCIGAPTLTVAYADNQQIALRALADLGILETPRHGEGSLAAAIGDALAELIRDPARRRQLAQRSREVVDGLGALRVGLALAAPTLSVRAARLDDARTIHRWRNDARTRAVSISRDPIPWESHLEWLDAALVDERRTLLVGSVGSIAVGVIRFDRSPEGATEVSLYLDPALHGLGLGGALLAAGETHEATRRGEIPRFTATVKEANVASQSLFESAGYARAAHERWVKNDDARKSKRVS
jgi:UDP-2,4-diacetamido-2,4,6-trideoxy-beta-L-altropyranose hydrolase